MNNVLAAEVLREQLHFITDATVKTATELAIETLYLDAIDDWHKLDTDLTAEEYLRLNDEEYTRWIFGRVSK